MTACTWKTKIISIPFVAGLLLAFELLLYAHSFLNLAGDTVFLPNTRTGRYADPEFFADVSGQARFPTNSMGLRGEMPRKNDLFGVFLGNSTVENLWLDDSEAIHTLLGTRLSELTGRPVVVNCGARSGLVAAHSTAQLDMLVSKGIVPDFVLVMQGGPDFSRLHTGRFRELTQRDIRSAFQSPVFRWKPWPESSDELMLAQYADKMLERAKNGFRGVFGLEVQRDRNGSEYPERRANYRNAPVKLSRFPAELEAPLARSLTEFSEATRRLIDICRKNRIMPVLVTQPLLHSEKDPEAAASLFQLRNPATKETLIFSPELHYRGLSRYAEVYRKVAKSERVPLVDLYSLMDGRLDCFYDQIHFSEKGSEVAADASARVISSHLLEFVSASHSGAGPDRDTDSRGAVHLPNEKE